MNPCPEWHEEILDLALGVAPSDALRAHFSGCEACAAALWEFRERAARIDEGVRALARGEPSAFLASRILVQAATRPPFSTWSARFRLALAAFALIALVTTGVHAVRGSIERQRTEAAQAAARNISSWHSPTEALLRSSADPLLKTLPRLGETYFELKPEVRGAKRNKGENNAT